MTMSKAAVPRLHILEKSAGAELSNPCHLQVQEFREPDEVLEARLLVIVEEKIVVMRAITKLRKERRVDAILRLCSLRGCT